MCARPDLWERWVIAHPAQPGLTAVLDSPKTQSYLNAEGTSAGQRRWRLTDAGATSVALAKPLSEGYFRDRIEGTSGCDMRTLDTEGNVLRWDYRDFVEIEVRRCKMRSFNRLRSSAIIFCVIAVLAFAVGRGATEGQQFLTKYKQLKVGMPKSAVQTLFGSTPTYDCILGEYDVWYYRDHGMFTRDFPATIPKRGSKFKTASDLPDTFGYLQLAFDKDEKLYAYTWIGETYTVESKVGSVNGTHFKLLPSTAFK